MTITQPQTQSIAARRALRVSRGVPSGGQFSGHTRADSAVGLLDAVASSRLNTAFPQPQANNLEKVASVVDAIAAGANTGEAVGESLGMATREGSYYADAAGYLGLIQTAPGQDVKTYELTGAGEELLTATPRERVETLRSLVAEVPAVQAYADLGDGGVRDFMGELGLGETTGGRRASTASSWYQALAAAEEFEYLVNAEVTGTRERAVVAALHAEEARALRLATAVAAQEKPMAVCPTCFMGLPMSGICDNCG